MQRPIETTSSLWRNIMSVLALNNLKGLVLSLAMLHNVTRSLLESWPNVQQTQKERPQKTWWVGAKDIVKAKYPLR